ncbi:DUF4164 domain-containing protein [Bartonella ancashensis]|uniref:DUF4164 family protein n=1 Tax=Bartonella ancashensis TaxID=1318743 RepID=A0A0M4LIY8_9HYPH|nr:DUF4164 domain-containing protein [Bartonella ancashensis]ALE03139.1 hypothetical protein PU02_0325 [Bartonella ancashensis]
MNQETQMLPEKLNQLNNALKHLEKTVMNHTVVIDKHSELEEEVQKINADRSHLAQELDRAEAHAEQLKTANKEVSKRLIHAMETIRSILDR